MGLKKIIAYIIFTVALLNGCTKLDETFRGDLTEVQVGADSSNTAALLQGIYTSLQFPFTSQLVVFPLQELSTDEAIAPTRGGDWDDNGVWRVLHQHKWVSNNDVIKDCFNRLNGISFAATDLLRYSQKPTERAEARFIRAWAMYLLLDLFDQVPYRDPGESLVEPARVRKGIEALDYIINEIKAVEPDLHINNPEYKANRFAAKVLLMKSYLNKAIYINRSDPVFGAADLNQVIILADSIINSNKFSFSRNYFDNFAPDNDAKSRDNIFTLFNDGFATPDNFVAFTYSIILHYSQPPPFGGGFNGWTTLSDFYDKFEPTDKRRGGIYSVPGSPPNPGNHTNIGFLIGQQYSWYTGNPLTDNSGASLIFTREVKNIELGANLQSTGIRPLKYFPDPGWWDAHNDFVFFRFSDVLLMKAEAIFRGGTGTNAGSYGKTALDIVNAIRTDSSRAATPLTSINRDILFDERGRELWWEGWRRQDMIRFGKFLQSFQGKEYQSDRKYLIYPIPDEQLAVNPYLRQNPGY